MSSSPVSLPETSQLSNLVMNLLHHPLSTSRMPLVLSYVDHEVFPPWKLPHLTGRHSSLPSCIVHSSGRLLQRTGPEFELIVWKVPFHTRQNAIEQFTQKADWDSLVHGLVISAYWIFAEWLFIEVNWKDPEVSGFLWLSWMSLLPVLK